MSKKALIIDRTYMARAIVNVERAFTIVYKGNAEVIEEYDEYFKLSKSNKLKIAKPSIIKVFSYVNVPYHKVPITKQNVYKRDNHTCVYCGCKNRQTLTIDHVIPKSKGGKDTFENMVTACFDCNNEKDSLDVEEWGKPHPNPKRPHHLMLMKQIKEIPEGWKPFLFF